MTNRKRLTTIAIMAVSIASASLFVSQINSESGLSLFSQNLSDEKTFVDFIEMSNGNFAVQGVLGSIEASAVTDTMFLTDEPANWFKSATGGALPLAAGTPLTVVTPGDAVLFDLDDKSDSKHTVSLLLPVEKLLTVDQSKADDNAISVTFDDPGVYLFSCKVHPYMQGVVVVTEENGDIPKVTDADLPYLAKAGIPELDATTVASLLTNVAPLNDDPGVILADLKLDKETKWDILENGDDFNGYTVGDTSNFAGGVGEIWINTQFESVAGQVSSGENKPGSITVLNAVDLTIQDEMNGLTSFDGAQENTGKWNNPHNMWTNTEHDVIYNGNWFGQWLNLIDRDNGEIIDTITVGKAPTHIVTIPDGPEQGILTLPLSGEDEILKIEDRNGQRLKTIDHFETGTGNNHPHGQWITADGSMILVPNVFQGAGIAGSIDILDSESGEIIKEFTTDSNGEPLLLPVAAAIGKVNGVNTGYVSNIGTGTVSVIDMDSEPPAIINDITVACFTASDGKCGATPDTGIVLETLKLPIQTPASPDGKYVVTAVFSLVSHLNPDTIAIIDAEANDGKGELIAELPCPAGCHGVNWGAKQGGGYYAYVTSQHANVLTVVDPVIADIVAIVPLTNSGENLTDGTGGQGILPLPLIKDGWIQDTVEACEVEDTCDPEVAGWISQLTPEQKNPSDS